MAYVFLVAELSMSQVNLAISFQIDMIVFKSGNDQVLLSFRQRASNPGGSASVVSHI